MFKRIFTLMRQDWTNSLRDNIMVYMIFGPILLAIGARFFLGSLDQAQFTFAVQADLGPAVIERLDHVGTVHVLPSAEAVRERVLRNDDVPGLVIGSEGQMLVVFEGNEGENPQALLGVIEQALLAEPVAAYTVLQPDTPRSMLSELFTIVFVMIGTLLGALVMAFNLIEDKETRAVRALGVTPLSMLEMTLSRGLFAILISLLITTVTTFVLAGTSFNYGLAMVAFLFSMGLPILTGYVIGGLADNQLKAIALLKFYMLIYLTLPIVSVFVPRSWHPFFYILPNYWMWQTFEKVFIGDLGGPNFWMSGLITLASSLALVVLLLPVLRKQLKLR
jgi:ABC-2 type transport system permease protein